MSFRDLAKIESSSVGSGETGVDDGASPSGRSAAALERELQAANRRILAHDAERMLFILFAVVVWNAHVFPGFENWASIISILVLELIGIFILAYRLSMIEVVRLYWGIMKSYGGRHPGTAPGDDDPK